MADHRQPILIGVSDAPFLTNHLSRLTRLSGSQSSALLAATWAFPRLLALIKLLLFVQIGSFPDRAKATTNPQLGTRAVDKVDNNPANRRKKSGYGYGHEPKRNCGLIFFIQLAAQENAES
ncbi:MAG TPA: hypothetical protein VE242_11280, partial [Chthoniobacterales bacterium]|nr:hypothetical protein [Chthoniobacterales bacterium]